MKDLFQEIDKLKRDRKAIILAHYYQEPDIQDIADYVGDSLGLSKQAVHTSAEVILFAGVYFMAETAKILNPQKKVLLPDLDAGCSLVDSCPTDKFKSFREKHSDHVVVSYVNSSAEVKAQSYIICTSSNAVKVVNSIPRDKPIIFAPDKNLGAYVEKVTKRKMRLWEGSCVVHEIFSHKKIVQLQAKHRDALLIAHPECEDPILQMADYIGSTTALINYVTKSPKKTFIVATESGVLHQMKKQNPYKTLIPAPPNNSCACNECPHMRKNTLEKVYSALETLSPDIVLEESIRLRALEPINRMLVL